MTWHKARHAAHPGVCFAVKAIAFLVPFSALAAVTVEYETIVQAVWRFGLHFCWRSLS